MKKCPVCGKKSESDVTCSSCGIPMIEDSSGEESVEENVEESAFEVIFEEDSKNSIVNECESYITTNKKEEKTVIEEESKENIVIAVIAILLLVGVLGSGFLMEMVGLAGIVMMALQLKGVMDFKSYIK